MQIYKQKHVNICDKTPESITLTKLIKMKMPNSISG